MLPENKEIVFEENKLLVLQLSERDGSLVSPIDLSVDLLQPLYLETLRWLNFDSPPAKVKLSNTGETIVLSAKWGHQRPHLAGGPLDSNYVFSQIHFHWGSDEHEGSEHTVRGVCYPMEMHVVFFKTRYLSQEAALKKDDGVIIVVYLFKLGDQSSSGLRWLASYMDKVVEPHSATFLPPSPLSSLLVPFSKDYLLYWGALATTRCSHTMLWFISRAAMAVSIDDLNVFRKMMNSRKEFMNKNFQGANPALGRTIFHVNPSGETKNLLLPGTVEPPGQLLIVNFNQMQALNKEQAQRIFSQGDGSGEETDKQSVVSDDKVCNPLKSSLNTYIFSEGTERSRSEKYIEGTQRIESQKYVQVKKKLDSKRSSLVDGAESESSQSDWFKRKQVTERNKREKYEDLQKKVDSRSSSLVSGTEGSLSSKSDSIKRREVLTRKLLESERKNVNRNTPQKIGHIDRSEHHPVTLNTPKAKGVHTPKNLTSKKVQPYIRKQSEYERNDLQSNKASQGFLNDTKANNNSEASKMQGDISCEEENFKDPEKNNDIETNGNVVDAVPPKDMKSRLPVSSKSKDLKLKSTLAQYFSRPESAPTCQGTRKFATTRKSTPLESSFKKSTLKESSVNVRAPRPSISSIPRPYEKTATKFNKGPESSSKKQNLKSPVGDHN